MQIKPQRPQRYHNLKTFHNPLKHNVLMGLFIDLYQTTKPHLFATICPHYLCSVKTMGTDIVMTIRQTKCVNG